MPLNQTLRKNSSILWTISLIQDKDPEAQTKTEFNAMAEDIIAAENIENVTLCLADHLQRFRLMIEQGLNEEDAIKKCDEMVNNWYQENADSLKKLQKTKAFSVLAWKEFLAWPDRTNTLEALKRWHESNREFKNDVDGRIRQALQSLPKDAKLSDPIQQTTLLKQYLFEECAFQKFAATKRFQYEIYKTPTSKSMRRVKNNSDFVPPGFMVEVYFTQFNLAAKKKQRENHNHSLSTSPEEKISSALANKNSTTFSEVNSFLPIFSHPKPNKPHQKPSSELFSLQENGKGDKSPGKKFAAFIEKTLELVPPEQQDEAIKQLIEFTTQRILPLCYLKTEKVINM